MFAYISNSAHYKEVLSRVLHVKDSLWIGMTDVEDLSKLNSNMIGSIIGDIVGSIYEFGNIKTKDFEFLSDKCSFTDDSVLTVATADWILNGGEVAKYYSRYGYENPWPMGGYGESFKIWIVRSNRQGDYRPYNSCGNGYVNTNVM